jgi:hypothetical protein
VILCRYIRLVLRIREGRCSMVQSSTLVAELMRSQGRGKSACCKNRGMKRKRDMYDKQREEEKREGFRLAKRMGES